MPKYELTGKVHTIHETQTFDSGFQKREFVVEVPSKYPQEIKLELIKDNVAALDNCSIGDEVRVHFDIRGNEYKGKHYVNLVAWLEMVNQSEPEPEPTQEVPPVDHFAEENPSGPADDEDIPFAPVVEPFG